MRRKFTLIVELRIKAGGEQPVSTGQTQAQPPFIAIF